MSLKGRLRPLERRVEWLETEGRFRRIEIMIKLLEMKQQIADRLAVDPAAAAQWKKDYADLPWDLPPPSPHLRPRAPEPEAAPRAVPILRDAAVPAAPQEEVVRVQVKPLPVERPAPPPPEPLPGQPVTLPSPDMEIRPVRWGPRTVQDYDEEERPGTNGRCITEYDVLRDEDDDDEP